MLAHQKLRDFDEYNKNKNKSRMKKTMRKSKNLKVI
jgi:hypothetical protein